MKIAKKLSIELTQKELRSLCNELDDIGFGADDMSDAPQPDTKWPTLSRLYETLSAES